MKRLGFVFTTCVLLLSFAVIAQGTTTESLLDCVINETCSIRVSNVASTSGLDVSEETALTNTVHPLVDFTHTTSATPANGIGLSLRWLQETAAANTENGANIAVIATDVTAASEDFQMDFQLMTAGAAPATKWSLGSTGVVTLVNGETIDNSVNGTITYTATTHDFAGNVTSSGSVDIVGAGGLILENDETITNSADGVISVDGTFDITAAGGLVLSNDETITNAVNGVISVDGTLDITAAGGLVLSNDETITNAADGIISVDGTFDITAAGGLVLSNDETITNAVNGAVVTDGTFQAPGFLTVDATEASGALVLNTTTASSGALTGATDKIEVNIPSGALLHSCQLRVDVAVVNDGDNTWAAAYSGGATAEIAAAATAAAKNTKVNAFFDANAATAIASGETDITLTPQAASFTAGEITAVCYYYTLTSLDDAP